MKFRQNWIDQCFCNVHLLQNVQHYFKEYCIYKNTAYISIYVDALSPLLFNFALE